MGVEDLITEMQELKAKHDTLTKAEILKIFEIQAMRNLTDQLRRLKNG